MDLLLLWKATSIVLTGLFGILALLTEYKDKASGKITFWGKISLAGILVSTVCGLTAQFAEQSRAEIKRAEEATRARALAETTSATLKEVARLLTPLENPLFSLQFEVPCDAEPYKTYCTKAFEVMLGFRKEYLATGIQHFENNTVIFPYPRDFPAGGTKSLPVIVTEGSSIWRHWPYFRDGDIAFTTNVAIFKEWSDVIAFFAKRFDKEPDLSLLYFTALKDRSGAISLLFDNDLRSMQLHVSTPSLARFHRSEKLVSTRDLSGATMVLFDGVHDLAGLRPIKISFVTAKGQNVAIDAGKIELWDYLGKTAIVYRFPK